LRVHNRSIEDILKKLDEEVKAFQPNYTRNEKYFWLTLQDFVNYFEEIIFPVG